MTKAEAVAFVETKRRAPALRRGLREQKAKWTQQTAGRVRSEARTSGSE